MVATAEPQQIESAPPHSVRTCAATHAWMLRTLWAKTAVRCQTTLDSVAARVQDSR